MASYSKKCTTNIREIYNTFFPRHHSDMRQGTAKLAEKMSRTYQLLVLRTAPRSCMRTSPKLPGWHKGRGDAWGSPTVSHHTNPYLASQMWNYTFMFLSPSFSLCSPQVCSEELVCSILIHPTVFK